jgi:hypothetical protein
VSRLSQEVKKEDIRKIASSLEERAKTLDEFGKTRNGLSKMIASLNKMSGKPETMEEKSKLIKIGTSLVLFPEPTPITPVVGASLITAGLLESKFKKKPLTIYQTKKEVAETLKELEKLRKIMI